MFERKGARVVLTFEGLGCFLLLAQCPAALHRCGNPLTRFEAEFAGASGTARFSFSGRRQCYSTGKKCPGLLKTRDLVIEIDKNLI